MITTDIKNNKFLFDLNNFDEEFYDGQPEEEEEPPVPTFSEEELATEKQKSYEEGKLAGLSEARGEREKVVGDILNQISQRLPQLTVSEKKRNEEFQAEALTLVRAFIEKIFPTLNKKYGIDEIMTFIESVIEQHDSSLEIIVEVSPEYVLDIQKHIDQIFESSDSRSKNYRVTGNDKLNTGDCKIQWAQGGAHRYANKLAEEILGFFEETLADKPSLKDNDTQEDEPVAEENSGQADQDTPSDNREDLDL